MKKEEPKQEVEPAVVLRRADGSIVELAHGKKRRQHGRIHTAGQRKQHASLANLRTQRFDCPAQDGYAVQRSQKLVDALHTQRAAGCDDNGRAADISPAHSAITVFLNSAPLTIKFLKRSKAALAGDSSTISPGFACCAAA